MLKGDKYEDFITKTTIDVFVIKDGLKTKKHSKHTSKKRGIVSRSLEFVFPRAN